ncbi:MAG: 2-isopropylmalate synthase [Gammaproteobacteria bacterium RIFCSPHIGHO2_12_FULL_35_23]|nr:MAG: 2-isopropylmalate synthase [Gammaproteobacteria bacterium RIFCSPHIGHO2_12_FULL_35_23]
MKKQQQIFIFDTTLRDGQQSPGAGMSFEDNLIYADYAEELGVDILEAGFPAASQNDFKIVHTIAKNMAERQSKMIIAALCQLREEQVICTMEALQPSLKKRKARLHTYVPVDPNLMQASLGNLAQNYSHIITEVHRLIKLAADFGFEVEFSPEGYSRMEHNFDFVTDVIRAAISAGARIINCPDTIGGATRWQGEKYFISKMQQHADIIASEFPGYAVIWSVHCHNDLGLALDNTMAAVFSGPACQIEGCINGVGERAGNVALEQCIIMIDQFGKKVNPEYNFYTSIDLKKINKISNFIAEKMLMRQPHWPIIGENAARHSSGGHTNAILKNPMAYQPFDPERVGNKISFVFGPLSGSNHAKDILEKNGFYCPAEEKMQIAQAIKDRYSARRKGITDEELIEGFKEYCAPIRIDKIYYVKDREGNTTLCIQGKFFSKTEIFLHSKSENSALSALDNEVKQYFPVVEIVDYRSNSCLGNTVNAKCNSTIIIKVEDVENYIGKAVDADINISVIKAYIDAVNQAYINKYYRLNEVSYA